MRFRVREARGLRRFYEEKLKTGRLFLPAKEPLPAGTVVQVVLTLPNGGEFPLLGEVFRRIPAAGNRPAGLGIRLLDFDEKTQLKLRVFIAVHEGQEAGPPDDARADGGGTAGPLPVVHADEQPTVVQRAVAAPVSTASPVAAAPGPTPPKHVAPPAPMAAQEPAAPQPPAPEPVAPVVSEPQPEPVVAAPVAGGPGRRSGRWVLGLAFVLSLLILGGAVAYKQWMSSSAEAPHGRPGSHAPAPGAKADAMADELARNGHAWLAEGRNDEARSAFEKALSIQERSHSALSGLGELAFSEGDASSAIEYGERAVALAPHVADYRMRLGSAYFATGAYAEALEQWQVVLEIDPDNSAAARNIETARAKLE